MAFQTKKDATRFNHPTIPMEKVLQAQTKSCLAKSRNQDEDPCPNLPEFAFLKNIRKIGKRKL